MRCAWADLLADQGKASAAKTAVQSAVKAYNTADFIGNLRKLYDPKQSLQEKLQTLVGLVPDPAFRNNPLAQDMLNTAIAGLVATNQIALDNLVRELDAFSHKSPAITKRPHKTPARRPKRNRNAGQICGA
jgi:hypothetical protein